ncbi:MAG: hypothetical protein A2X61_16225 [Ignavibacteria bacterium GWB2_35_12]|nr:MAG: hypothetical protein A2X63_10840 [Ignavibacteria bacterium GWA2_35_8]OGU39934.1 MAG: hypothetical protein A2X61_16225 [Ignavibacteria bacterium GWB2_35_12]OGU91416.1 MAG: hypothetical protein A2220_08525 [Ignavibacteria bacterium RIFOXYA2_FULL_35_10]OGV22202.1 MAG: hypothetical protein A2475_06825 [Ignavibacteria bacterium RIFOXYC2_FULL_35_21]
MADIREMTVADFEREFSEASIEEVIRIMQAVKSVSRDRVKHRMSEEGCKEFVRTMDDCIFKLESIVKRYLTNNSY